MAILFDDASSEYIELDNPPVTAAPFTMACWFNSDSVALAQNLMWIGDKDGDAQRWHLQAAGATVGDPVTLTMVNGAASGVAASSSGYSANTWHHACGVVASATDRRAFIDGGSKGTNATSGTPSGADRISIARYGGTTPGSTYMSGLIAEAAIWNIALSDAEVALLGLGASPFFVHPEALVFYLPMISLGSTTQTDWIGGRVMVEANTPVTGAHPPKIFYPSWLTTGYGIAALSSALSGTLRFTGAMSAVPLAANYKIFSVNIPKRTFVIR